MKQPHSAYFDFAALYRAWQSCRRGKRGTRQAQRYEMDLLDKLVDTAQALQTGAWHPSRASRFVTLHPKPREILAANYADRVVHHLLVPWLERHFEPVFIHDSFANRRGKGTHAAVERLQAFTRAYGAESAIQTDVDFFPLPAGERARERGGCFAPLTPTLSPLGRGGETHLPHQFESHPGADAPGGGWYMQLDIANFFHSINRRTLFGIVQQRLARDLRRPSSDARHAQTQSAQDMLHLTRTLLTGNPALNADYCGNPANLQRVPAHKQLANAAPGHGLPIGNLTSQFFANVYLNELDQFIKHQLKVRHYVRYVDDFVLLHADPAQLRAWQHEIAHFLHERLGLDLRQDVRLAPIANGIDFLGYIVRPDYKLVRQRVVGHMHARMQALAKRVIRSKGTLVSPPAASDRVQATVASYFGHFHHARSQRLQRETLANYPWLAHILAQAEDGSLVRVDRPPLVTSLVSQWTYFRARYPLHVLLVQVGNRWECEGPGMDTIPALFRRTSAQRRGLPQTWSVPAVQVRALKRLLTRRCQPWCEVGEHGYVCAGKKKRRQLVAVWPALHPSDFDSDGKQQNLLEHPSLIPHSPEAPRFQRIKGHRS